MPGKNKMIDSQLPIADTGSNRSGPNNIGRVIITSDNRYFSLLDCILFNFGEFLKSQIYFFSIFLHALGNFCRVFSSLLLKKALYSQRVIMEESRFRSNRVARFNQPWHFETGFTGEKSQAVSAGDWAVSRILVREAEPWKA